jgi:hypothetical protein
MTPTTTAAVHRTRDGPVGGATGGLSGVAAVGPVVIAVRKNRSGTASPQRKQVN